MEYSDTETDATTIRERSPFYVHFASVLEKTEYAHSGPTNAYHCPFALNVIRRNFLHVFPMWSELILQRKLLKTRDSNSPIELWFNILKNRILPKMSLRPSVYIRKVLVSMRGRLRGFKSSQQQKKKRKIDNPLGKEEGWQKRKNKIQINVL